MSGYVKSIAAKIAAKKSSRMATGWGAWFVSSWLFDDLLYPAVIAWRGPLEGGAIMTALAVTLCWIWMKRIVASDREWFGMDVLHKIEKIVFRSSRIAARIPSIREAWITRVEFGVTFLLLNLQFDPMITTLYFRYGDAVKTISAKDKKIFVWSAVVSNGYWILRSWGLVVLIKLAWENIQTWF